MWKIGSIYTLRRTRVIEIRIDILRFKGRRDKQENIRLEIIIIIVKLNVQVLM